VVENQLAGEFGDDTGENMGSRSSEFRDVPKWVEKDRLPKDVV